MDITRLAAAETARIHLKDPRGGPLMDDGKPVVIVVYGPGSKAGAAVLARAQDRSLKRIQDNDGKVSLPSYEQRQKEEAEDLAELTVAFENLTYPPAKGKAGRELYEAVYADPALGWIKQQVAKPQADWAQFVGNSPAS